MQGRIKKVVILVGDKVGIGEKRWGCMEDNLEIMTPRGMITLTKEETALALECIGKVTDALLECGHDAGLLGVHLFNKMNVLDPARNYKPVYMTMPVARKKAKRRKGVNKRGKKNKSQQR